MLQRLLSYLGRNVIGLMALFVALGGTAYAVNTVNSSDIVDGQVKSVDVGDGELKSADVKDESLTTFDVSTFLGADVVNGSLTGDDIADESVSSIKLDGPLGIDVIGNSVYVDLNVGSIPATNCVSFPVDLPGEYQHSELLLTLGSNAHPALVYSIHNSQVLGKPDIVVCNFAGAAIDDGHTNFKLANLFG
jgi:hypothetical protein